MLHKFNVLFGFFFFVFFLPNKLFAELISNNDYCIIKHILTNNNHMMQSSGASKALRTVVLLINWNNGSSTVILEICCVYFHFIFLSPKNLANYMVKFGFLSRFIYSDLYLKRPDAYCNFRILAVKLTSKTDSLDFTYTTNRH